MLYPTSDQFGERALPRETYGTLRYEEENLGRRLVFVVWDNGMNVPIFPDEVEVLETETATTA